MLHGRVNDVMQMFKVACFEGLSNKCSRNTVAKSLCSTLLASLKLNNARCENYPLQKQRQVQVEDI